MADQSAAPPAPAATPETPPANTPASVPNAAADQTAAQRIAALEQRLTERERAAAAAPPPPPAPMTSPEDARRLSMLELRLEHSITEQAANEVLDLQQNRQGLQTDEAMAILRSKKPDLFKPAAAAAPADPNQRGFSPQHTTLSPGGGTRSPTTPDTEKSPLQRCRESKSPEQRDKLAREGMRGVILNQIQSPNPSKPTDRQTAAHNARSR